MKEKSGKIVGVLIIFAGILELVIGIHERTASSILLGLCFGIIGSLYLLKKGNKR